MSDKDDGWQGQLQRIESDHEYIPKAVDKLEKLVEKVPVQGRKVSPPVWMATSESGHKLYLVGTSHRLRLRHLSPFAITRLGEIWDEAAVVMWEGDSIQTKGVSRMFAEYGYPDILRELKQLDYQILAFGINRGEKEIVSLEGDVFSTTLKAKVEERLDREGHDKLRDPREEKEGKDLTDNEKERYLEEIIDNYELTFLEMTSYVNHDVKGRVALGKRRGSLIAST